MEKTGESKAALYELLAKSFLFTSREVADALVSGDYGEALAELVAANGLPASEGERAAGELDRYRGRDGDEVLHALRREYTRLYIGTRGPLIAPFAGTWDALEKGRKPLLFVGKESMEIERCMRRCGIAHAGKSNDPLDHIGSMLEFLMHLCTLEAGLVDPPANLHVPESAYRDFYGGHFIGFAHAFGEKTMEESREGFFKAAGLVLRALPDKPL